MALTEPAWKDPPINPGRRMADKYAALHGLVEQLPRSAWTAEKRQQWIEALLLVLDYTVAIRQPRPDEVADTEEP